MVGLRGCACEYISNAAYAGSGGQKHVNLLHAMASDQPSVSKTYTITWANRKVVRNAEKKTPESLL